MNIQWSVRKELLSERDGNLLRGVLGVFPLGIVRKELLSERDGNNSSFLLTSPSCTRCQEGTTLWKRWKRLTNGVASCCCCRLSGRNYSLKEMETTSLHIFAHKFRAPSGRNYSLKEMETCYCVYLSFVIAYWSGRNYSLKEMETLAFISSINSL